MSEEEGKGFKVTDRRAAKTEEEAATAEGAAEAPEESESAEQPATDTAPEDADAADTEEAPPGAAEGAGETIPITFATFLMSLGESAMVHLGMFPNPATGEATADLRSARQTIDILGVLADKTQGNLDEEEGKLLNGLLYTLRMQYIEAQSGGKE